MRLTVISLKSSGRLRVELSNTMLTCAIFSGARLAVPLKIISTIEAERSAFQLISPMVQRTESMTLDLPQPLGPTTQVMPGSKSRRTLSAKDLKPTISMAFKYMKLPSFGKRIYIVLYIIPRVRARTEPKGAFYAYEKNGEKPLRR